MKRSCDKVRYPAYAVAVLGLLHAPDSLLTVYKCRACKGWHLTSSFVKGRRRRW